MRSDATTVPEYIAAAPLERRPALERLRRLCREELAGGLRQAALAAGAEILAGLSVGKGCIRFRRSEQTDPAAVRVLLRAMVADAGPIC